MATTYENQVLNETFRREKASQIEWGRQNAPDSSIYELDSEKFARLSTLKSKVADLCDLQPTPASMVRPPRKEALKELKKELTAALEDVEGKLDQLGGSASTVSTRTARSVATKRSVAPSTAAISEAGEE